MMGKMDNIGYSFYIDGQIHEQIGSRGVSVTTILIFDGQFWCVNYLY